MLFPTARQYNPASLSTSHRGSSGYRRVREKDKNTHKEVPQEDRNACSLIRSKQNSVLHTTLLTRYKLDFAVTISRLLSLLHSTQMDTIYRLNCNLVAAVAYTLLI